MNTTCRTCGAEWHRLSDHQTFSLTFQHGANPEHARVFTRQEIYELGPENSGQALDDWLDAIHRRISNEHDR